MVHLTPAARAKRLFKELPAFLGHLEAWGFTEVGARHRRFEAAESVEGRARKLGIVSADQSGTDIPGSVYLTIERASERTGGMADGTATAVAPWVRDFLLDPHQSDVLGKLARSGAKERHAFIIVPTFSTAPFCVTDQLWRPADHGVPAQSPRLPDQVSHVWLMPSWTPGSGLQWSAGRGWARFVPVLSLGA